MRLTEGTGIYENIVVRSTRVMTEWLNSFTKKYVCKKKCFGHEYSGHKIAVVFLDDSWLFDSLVTPLMFKEFWD